MTFRIIVDGATLLVSKDGCDDDDDDDDDNIDDRQKVPPVPLQMT